jgi:hypothetical protein
MLTASPLAADLGEPVRTIEVAPLELPIPAEPPEPVREPAPEPDAVPVGWSR